MRSTRFGFGALVVSATVVGILACDTGKKAPPPTCVAHVRDVCIERKQLKPPFRYVTLRKPPPNEASARFVLDGAIERELLTQEAKKQGITVSDAEVDESVKRHLMYVSTPGGISPPQLALDAGVAFIDDLVPAAEKQKKLEAGVSDEAAFEDWIKVLANSTPAEFHEWQARELLAAKVLDRVRDGVKVSDDDAFADWSKANTTATVDYVIVKTDWLSKYAIRYDDKDADAWAKAHPDQLVLPVHHILATGKNEQELAAAKTKAEGILERVKKGEDWDKLSKELSEDKETKDKGGYYSGEDVQSFVEEFQEAVKKLKPGELAPTVVRSAYGWHVLRRDPTTHAANLKAFLKSKSEDLAKVVAKEILDAVKGGKTLRAATAEALAKYGKYGKGPAAAAADPDHLAVETTAPFREGAEPISQFNPVSEKKVATFAFTSPAGTVAPEAIDTWMGPLLYESRGVTVPTREDFAKNHDAAVAPLLHKKQAEAVRDYLKQLREAAKDQITIDADKLWPKDGGARDGGG